MKRQKDRTLKDELCRMVGAQYANGDQWRNNPRNEEMEPKQKQHPVIDVTGDGSKVRCCKEQYCIGTWDVRSINQDKLEVAKQDFPGASDGKASVSNAGELGSIPGSGRSPGEGNGNPPQYYCLENPMDRGAW